MSEARRTAAERGYDARWRRRRKRYLRDHPTCCLCGDPSEVPDHHPLSREQLLEQGVDNPDADEYLRPLCTPCHNKETAKHQPGGWAAAPPRRRPPEKHPGMV